MKITTKSTATCFFALWAVCGLGIAWQAGVSAADTLSTEDFLNTLGVNTHLQGPTPADRWNTNINEIHWAHPLGLCVSQMEFGAGWTAANGWQGNYNPTNTGTTDE